MAPRRGGGSSSSYSSYDDSPWGETVWLSLEHYQNKPLFIVQFVFDILSLLALVAFLIWACTIRNRSLPLKGVICALTSFIFSQINMIVLEAMLVAETKVTMYYLISFMLIDFFKLVAICLTLYVFWGLIHRFLGLIRASGKPHAAVTTIHSVFLGIIFLVSLAEWGLCVAYYVRSVTSHSVGEIAWTWTQLNGAAYIVYWVLSTEILAWVIFVAIKAGNYAFASKLPAMALITAAISWCAVCTTVAIINIRYNLMYTSYEYGRPTYLETAKTIIQFVLWVGTYAGVLLCCAKWHSLGDGRNYPAPQYQPQYPPDQFPPDQFPAGQYPPIQQQPYGVAPYLDHSAQPQAHSHHVSRH
ncbi:unnamed protein product [Penicillium egyptiacum]|uniref:Uncharacterized protein n=1 Tax=Penicillium egyptiacum TaxID=1303716 RepID=A0A9W4P4T6_9EURO|nr:unnamed protein product [Penicillium egyptiacum]